MSSIIIIILTYVSSFGLVVTFGPIQWNIQQTIVNNMELVSGYYGEGWQSFNDLFVHSDIFISLMHILCNHGH